MPFASAVPHRSTLGRALLVAILALAVWWPSLSGGFRYDDYANVVRDPATSDAGKFVERLSTGIRPLTRLSYFLDHQRGGFEARNFLATQLVLHAASCVLLFALARRRFGDGAAASAAALASATVFALAPSHAAVVAYVSGRSAGLSTMLLLAGLLALDRVHPTEGADGADGAAGKDPVREWPWCLAAWSFFVAAVLARETALVFPLFVLLWQTTGPAPLSEPPAARPLWRRSVALSLGLAAVLALLLVGLPRYRTLAEFSLALRGPMAALGENLRGLPIMLSLWVRPSALAIEHAPPPDAWGALLAGIALVAVLFAAAIALRRRAPALAFAAGWVLVALLPTHSFIARSETVTERPLYLAWIGPAWLAGAVVLRASRRLDSLPPGGRRTAARGAALLAALILAAAMTAGVRQRLAVWGDEVRLWEEAVEEVPSSVRAWTNLGAARLSAGRYDLAAEAFGRALALDPARSDLRSSLNTAELLAAGAKGGSQP